MKVFAAPIQGYTDAPYRHIHTSLYSQADVYCAPFMHLDHGSPRKRDLKDITSPLNDNHRLLPQILFRNIDEFTLLSEAVVESGYRTIDLNLGCPFVPQIRKGRGAAMLLNNECMEQIASLTESNRDITYSIKMRLGVESPKEWHKIIPVINAARLSHVTIHPRIATQQYSGDLFMDEFSELLQVVKHPVVFNGDIRTPSDINSIAEKYPSLAGVMIGRGLLARPSIIEEWRTGREWTAEDRLQHLLDFHSELFEHYSSVLCGDTQILSKIKPFWEYPAEEIGKKSAKLIKKAGSIKSYLNAISSIENS